MYHNNTPIAILLATFNGEKYIVPQIESLIKQSYQDFTIFIRDDGSTDNTLSFCQQLQNDYPQKIKLLQDNQGNLGAKNSFNFLATHVQSTYYMFCDQDDIWLPTKIEDTLKFYQAVCQDELFPLMVYTDATVVNQYLNTLSPSLITYQHKNPYLTFNNGIFHGIGLGCTIFFNQALKKLAIPLSKEAVMHDSWLTKVALTCGKVHYLDKPTLLYRQHDNNVFGLNKGSIIQRLPKSKQAFLYSRGHQVFLESLCVLTRFATTDEQLLLLQTLQNSSYFKKIYFLYSHGYINLFLLRSYKSLFFSLWL